MAPASEQLGRRASGLRVLLVEDEMQKPFQRHDLQKLLAELSP